jgi:DNA polymerase-3 subunit beta
MNAHVRTPPMNPGSSANKTATVEVAALRKAIAATVGVVARTSTIPILQHVRIDVTASGTGCHLALTATDLEREMHVSTPCDPLSTPFATAVPGHMFADLVKRLPDGADVTLSLADERLNIACARARFALATLPAEDFPPLDQGGGHAVTLPAEDLRDLLSMPQIAISTEETRYYLNGICLHPVTADAGEPALRAVATNGHILIQVDRPLPAGAEALPKVIIPRRTVATMLAMCAGREDVALVVSEAKVSLTTEAGRLTSKLIDGTFPDYARVIPATPPDTTVEVDVDALDAAIERVLAVSTERGGLVKFDIGARGVVLAAKSSEGHASSDEVDAEVSGKDLTIGFSGSYMQGVLGALGSDRVTLMLGDAGLPARAVAEGQRALAVVMPMRV